MIILNGERHFSEENKEIRKKFYPDEQEEIPTNTPDPGGNAVKVSIYVY